MTAQEHYAKGECFYLQGGEFELYKALVQFNYILNNQSECADWIRENPESFSNIYYLRGRIYLAQGLEEKDVIVLKNALNDFNKIWDDVDAHGGWINNQDNFENLFNSRSDAIEAIENLGGSV
ncbi:MAG: hypothetical protein ACD_21C00258G0004 [uncultured bacterium]|nr:MAG: hypothetical protein ACD_21C00258G0004 [uncultured bacterium]